MFRTIFFIFIFVNILFAESYNFTELRYSDAIDKSIKFHGKISFLENGLNIFYPKKFRSLHYENNVLTYKEEEIKIELNEIQATKIMSYFDILIMIHKKDESSFDGIFNVSKSTKVTTLEPINNIKQYIKKIELSKEKKRLKYIKLFLKNNDSIKIIIHDETN